MRVFVYEYMTAVGLGRDPGSVAHGMYLEGRAMRDALAADFARIPGVGQQKLRDFAEPFLDEIRAHLKRNEPLSFSETRG